MRGDGNMKDWIMVALVAVILVMSTTVFGMALAIAARKSKPPVKVKDPNDIHRKDICEAYYDGETGSNKAVQDYAQAKAKDDKYICA